MSSNGMYPDRIDITIKTGPFAGVVYNIGEVSFPDEDEPIISFAYDVVSGEVLESQKSEFEKFIGDSLLEMIKEALEDKTLVFKGGI